jgi:hypothetical protein
MRQTNSTMRRPLEIATEVGSLLEGPFLAVCTTQLCRNGVGFVSRPSTDSAKVPSIHLYNWVKPWRTASHALGAGQERADGVATEPSRGSTCGWRGKTVWKRSFRLQREGPVGGIREGELGPLFRHSPPFSSQCEPLVQQRPASCCRVARRR